MTQRLIGIRAKIERSKEHVTNLGVALESFLGSNPYPVRTKDDADPKNKIFYISEMADIPAEILLTTGDAIHNLRSALDHIAWRLYESGQFRISANVRQIDFPIYDSPEKFEAEFPRIIKGSPKLVEHAIRATKPYKRGNDDLWILHRLDAIDKHRLLLAVAIHNPATVANIHLSAPCPLPTFDSLSMGNSALKAGDELLRITNFSDLQERVHFTFDITFREPEVVEGRPILPFLHQLCNLIGGIASAFAPLL